MLEKIKSCITKIKGYASTIAIAIGIIFLSFFIGKEAARKKISTAKSEVKDAKKEIKDLKKDISNQEAEVAVATEQKVTAEKELQDSVQNVQENLHLDSKAIRDAKAEELFKSC